MMPINEKIESLISFIEVLSIIPDTYNPVMRRLIILGIITEMQEIINRLNEINIQLDDSLSEEDAALTSSLLDSYTEKVNNSPFGDKRCEDNELSSIINKVLDMFPQDQENYNFTSANGEAFKTGLKYLCAEANMSERNITYALNEGVRNIAILLININKKKSNVKDYQWEGFWYEILYRDDDLWYERSFNDYEDWKEEHDADNIQSLKDKRTQEILKLLQSGVFTHDIKPVNREVESCKVNIPIDALEDGTEVDDKIKIECARFSKYVIMKSDIMLLDYVKLGKYLYKHYQEIKDEELDKLVYFDYMLDLIHDDMAKCDSKLEKYLKFYDDKKEDTALTYAIQVINCCKGCLKEDVSEGFLAKYLRESLRSEIKTEVKSKIQNCSKHSLICNMVGMLKSTGKVFSVKTTSQDLATAISTLVKKPNAESLLRYINTGASDYVTKLSRWTATYVADELGTKSERLFVGLSQETRKK